MDTRSVIAVMAVIASGCTIDSGPGGHQPGAIDPVLGATCGDDRDCWAQCEGGGDFPGGFCTLPCRSHLACPVDAVCATTHDGVCLFPCTAHVDCDFLGPGYWCREKRDFSGRAVFVCIGN